MNCKAAAPLCIQYEINFTGFQFLRLDIRNYMDKLIIYNDIYFKLYEQRLDCFGHVMRREKSHMMRQTIELVFVREDQN